MRLVTWNIQWGRGVDGRVDIARVAAEIRRLGEPDVICLQEVTSGFDDLAGNGAGADQFALLAAAFPRHQAIAGPVLDVASAAGGRKLFGNVILSRLPVGLVQRHTLPWRTEPGRECMPRGLLVATVGTAAGPVRVMTTHVEWSAVALRAAQIEAIRAVHAETALRLARPPLPGKASYVVQTETASAILAGDFNMTPDEPTRARLMAPFGEPQTPGFVDAFEAANPGTPHPPSMGLFDPSDGPARCLDYVFCTEDLARHRLSVTYDQTSRASDHQPVMLELPEARAAG